MNRNIDFVADAIQDAVRELEALEQEHPWYSAGVLLSKLESAIIILKHMQATRIKTLGDLHACV